MASHRVNQDVPDSILLKRFISIMVAVCWVSACAAKQEIEPLATDLYAQQEFNQFLPPSPFVSDGCSCWPDYTWVECCVVHDLAYWMGGTRQERLTADLVLKTCVQEQGYPLTAGLMYYGVRIGGVWWLPTPFRWGFGWAYPTTGPPGTAY
jgi:hypothetical protein